MRNRYHDVECYANNRIKLRIPGSGNDYINASPIRIGKSYYIATQGPKDITVNHFYRMVQSEIKGPAVIVMLTQTFESGKDKCFQYYPLSQQESPLAIPRDEEASDGLSGVVELISTEDDVSIKSQVRRLKMHTQTQDGHIEQKDITHLLYSAWPDHLVPEGDDRTALIKLVHHSAKLNGRRGAEGTEQDHPRIVHCSAGVGRSGTFIALDYLLGQLHGGFLDNVPANKDPILETVEILRAQRMLMVQSEVQFFLLYDIIREQFLQRSAAGHNTV